MEQQSEQTKILREILKWIRFAGTREVKNVLLAILDTEQKRLIYHLSDGDHSSLEIAKAAGTSAATVRRQWASWSRQGIVESLKVQGGERYKKSFELEDLGIEVPQVKSVASSEDSEPTAENEMWGEP